MLEEAISQILKSLGINLDDPNFRDTPTRFKKALINEILSGLNNTEEQVLKVLERKFPTKYEGIVIVADIITYSICPHHLLPVMYTIDIGYIPGVKNTTRVKDKKCLGLSKLARLAEILSKRPVLQEDLTSDIAKYLFVELPCSGVGVVIKGEHLCMRMRGVKQPNSVAITSVTLGSFRDSMDTRLEFFELLKLHKGMG